MNNPQIDSISPNNWVDRLPAPVAEQVKAHFVHRRLYRGEVIYERFSAPENVYYIVQGRVRIVDYSPEGREHVHIIFQRGDGFGDLEVLDGLPRCTAAIAHTRTDLAVLSRNDFFRLRGAHPEIDDLLLTLYCHRLRALMSWSEEASFHTLPQRIANRLHMLASKYGRPSCHADSGLDLDLTQEDLGRMLGVTRQSVSRELKDMEQRGILALHYGVVTLLDVEALRPEAAGRLGPPSDKRDCIERSPASKSATHSSQTR